MGLFRKTEEEKEIKRLTGGMFLNEQFKDKLKKDHLEPLDGLHIQSTLKEEVKQKKLNAYNIENRFNEIYNEIKKLRITILKEIESKCKEYDVILNQEEKEKINSNLRDKKY